MKKITFLHFACITIAVMIFTGCGSKIIGGSDSLIIVETIEAEANFDLTSRSDWNLTLNGVKYDATINGNKITGIPAIDPLYIYHYGNTVAAMLKHPAQTEYIRTEQEVNIKTQNTKDKLLIYDILLAECGAIENITGAKFKHQETLLEFTINGLPDNAEVYLTERDDITIWPCRNEENPDMYQAIVSPTNTYNSLALHIRIGDETYSQSIILTNSTIVESRMSGGYENSYLSNMMFTFDASIKPNKKDEDKTLTLSIENLIAYTTGRWSID